MVDQIKKLFSFVLVVFIVLSAEKGFAEEYPFTATLTCGMRGEHINILGCFSNTELEIQNGDDYRLYKIYEIHEAGLAVLLPRTRYTEQPDLGLSAGAAKQ